MSATLEAQIASLQAAAAEDAPEALPYAVGAPGAPSAAPAALILTTGTIEDIDPGAFPPTGDPYLPGMGDGFVSVAGGLATNCGAPFRAVRACGCASAAVRDHCDKKSCEHNYCAERNRTRRARDIEDRMEHSRRGRSLIYTVFTVPPSRREAAAERVTLRPRRKKDGTVEPREEWRWQHWLRELIEYLKDELGFDYGCERSDPAGAEAPDRWHPHINLLWVRKNGHGYLSPEDLGLLKARWKEIVGEAPEMPISIWTAFAQDGNVARRRHWYSYQGRTWPAWEEKFPYHCRIKWLGKPAKAPERDVDPCCPKCLLEVAVVRTGSQEAAEALAARGYEHVLAEYHGRLKELRKMAAMRKPAEWQKRGELVIRLGGPA